MLGQVPVGILLILLYFGYAINGIYVYLYIGPIMHVSAISDVIECSVMSSSALVNPVQCDFVFNK